MVAFDVQVELPLDAAAYLREKDSEAYKRFHADAMGTLEQEFLSSEIVDGEAVTVTRTVPTIDIPWALRRAILGNRRAEFVDTRRWTHGAHLTPPFSQRFHITNNITDRCVVTGVIVVDDAPGAPGVCSVRARGEAVVTLKGLGPAVEKLVVSNLRASYDRLPGIVEDWMATRSAGPGAAPEEASSLRGAKDRGPSPGRLGRRARRDSARRTGAFGSVIDVADLDLEAGAGVGSGAAYEDDEFKSPEAKARAGRAAGGGFVSRGRSLLFSALGSGGGTAPPRRSLRHRQAAASRRRRRPDRARRTVCGLRRSTSLSLACLAACLFVVYALVSGASLFASLSAEAGFTRVVTPRQEAAMEAAEDAEASVFDAVEHMADDIERSRQGALAAAADDIERAARLKHLRAGEDSFRETDAAASLEGQRACVDAREEECARWACAGECDANPGFMITECACACAAAARDAAAAAGGRASETLSGDVRPAAFAFLVSWSEALFFSEKGRHAHTDAGSASSDASSETLVEHDSERGRGEKRREARVRVRLHADADAPRTLRALRGALGDGRCAAGSFCGGGGACHFHRAELEYGLVQGTLPGLGEAGGAFGEPRLEGTSSWARGTVGYIPGGDNVLVATKPHPEWDAGFVAFGEVFEEDMAHIDALAGLPTEPFTHPEYKTVMAMLKRKVRFALEPA